MITGLGRQVVFENFGRVVLAGRDFKVLEATYSVVLETTYMVIWSLRRAIVEG